MTAMAPERLVPTVGTRYRVNARNPEGAQMEVGTTVECVDAPGDDGGSYRFQTLDENGVAAGRRWIIYPSHLDVLHAEDAPLAVGDRVHYRGNSIGEYQEDGRIGETGTVVQVPVDDSSALVDWDATSEEPARRNSVFLHNLERITTLTSAFVPDVVTREEHDRIVASLQEQVAAATARADSAQANAARLQTWQSSAQTDAETISNNLNDEAVRRDWCGDYDEIVGRINSRLTVLHLEERNVDYDVTWQETYEVTITRTATFEGVRGDSDGNSERAEEVRDNSESLNEYDLIQALRDNGNHSFTEYVDDSLEWDES